MLLLDAGDEFAYGFSSLEIINRKDRTQDRHERQYKKLKIEEKESYRWLEAICHTKRLLDKAKSLTIVADRESDIYELWSRVPDNNTHLVIRTSLRRFFHNQHKDNINPVDPSKSVGFTNLMLSSDSEKKRKGREAKIELFVQQAWTQKPKRLIEQKDNEDAYSVMLYVVVAKEVVIPKDKIQEPIEWTLLTDIKTETFQQANRITSQHLSHRLHGILRSRGPSHNRRSG